MGFGVRGFFLPTNLHSVHTYIGYLSTYLSHFSTYLIYRPYQHKKKITSIGQFVLRLPRGLDKVAWSMGHIGLKSFNALKRTNHIMYEYIWIINKFWGFYVNKWNIPKYYIRFFIFLWKNMSCNFHSFQKLQYCLHWNMLEKVIN